MQSIDYSGVRFGDLLVVKRIPEKGKKTKYLCVCSCGNKVIISGSNLVSGHTKACGHQKVKHGLARKERLYGIWANMRQRCNNNKSKDYTNYGLRGIHVCKQWDDYRAFRAWAYENGYNDSLSIDRINGDSDYCPENCRWVGTIEQNNNLRSNVLVKYNGKTHTLAEWARILEIPYRLLKERFYRGWTFSRIVEVGAAHVYH